MADIFISYARADRAFVERLVATLEAEGCSLWWDREIVGGAEFSKIIESEIVAAKMVLVVWSPASIDSGWVRDEANFGLQNGKLVPLSIGAALPPLGFRQYQAINFDNWDGSTGHESFKALRHAVAAPPVEPKPVAPEAASPAQFLTFLKARPATMAIAVAGIVVATVGLGLILGGGGKDGQPPAAIATSKAPVAQTRQVSIAVLPFVNMSGDPENEYFSDGITEEILNGLAPLKDLRVTSRTSSFAFKNSTRELPEIARALGVGHVLEGSVRKSGNQVRITVQLIRASDDAHLWSQTYDRELKQIFVVQQEISESVADALSVRLLGMEDGSGKEVNPVAYDHYLRGVALLETTVFSDVDKAMTEFQAAAAADPNLAKAYAGQATVLAFSVSTGKEPPNPTLSQAEQAAYKALSLDTDNGGAQAALGFVEFTRGNLQPAIAHWSLAEQSRALGELDYWFYAHALCDAGEIDRAREMLLRNAARDPLNAGIEFGLGIVYEALAEADQSLLFFNKAMQLEPENSYYLAWVAYVFATRKGDFPKGIRMLEDAIALDSGDPELYSITSYFYYSMGDDENARRLGEKSLEVNPDHSLGRFLEAIYLFDQGNKVEACEKASALLASGQEMRFGATQGTLTLLGRCGMSDKDLIATYEAKIPALAAFDETGDLHTVALVNTPAAFLGVNLAALLRRTGEAEKANRLAEWALNNIAPRLYSEFPGYQLVRAEALAVLSRDDEAMAEIEKIVASENVIGWQWRLRDNVNFIGIRERPEFEKALKTVTTRNEKSRAANAEMKRETN